MDKVLLVSQMKCLVFLVMVQFHIIDFVETCHFTIMTIKLANISLAA
mgnify:CR=1 FL=1